MNESRQTLLARANVEVTPETHQAIVQNAKEMAGPDETGVYRIDTAEMESEMITRFLLEKDFEAYARDSANDSG